MLRSRLARTLVDANRVLESSSAGMTAGLPAYVADADDRRLLAELHAEYTTLAEGAYAEVCSAGGLAVALHTYAPKSVDVEVDADVVGALRRAYGPALYRRWELRPPVDGITEDAAGRRLAPQDLVAALAARLAESGLAWSENRTYRLHAATMGYRHAARWPGRVLTVEFRRDLLGAPWRPFVESRIGPRKVARLASPLAAALAGVLG